MSAKGEKKTLYLNTDVDSFVRWFQRYTRDLSLFSIKTDKGYVVPQPVERRNTASGSALLKIKGFYYVEGKFDTALRSSLIQIELLPLGREQLELIAEYTWPKVKDFFWKTMLTIAEWRPEAAEQLGLRAMPEEAGADQVGEEKKERRMWDDTERKIKDLRKFRVDWMKEKNDIPLWTHACQQVGIDPKTVRRHDPELRKRWPDKEFREL
jgi:hypothetical protein